MALSRHPEEPTRIRLKTQGGPNTGYNLGKLVPRKGLEPPTPSLRMRCSTS